MRQTRSTSRPFAGVKVIDMTRLAPGPYGSMLLADLGAEVIVVGGGRTSAPIPALSRGKRFISLDLKSPAGREALRRLTAGADVFIEGFRPGVAARLGASYEELSALNPRLVYCSVTGYGQSGPRSQEAGHDINYLAIAGVLGAMGPAQGPPVPPLNIIADLAGGGLNAAFGIAAALFEREHSGRGQRLDVSMVDGCLSLMGMIAPLWNTSAMPARGEGLFNAPFYRTYRCADGEYVAVGALERPFFETLWKIVVGTPAPPHLDARQWPGIESELVRAFGSRERQHWASLCAGTDACVTPVLAPDEIADDPFFVDRHGRTNGIAPVLPVLSRTPGYAGELDTRDQTARVLAEASLGPAEIEQATAPAPETARTGLDWPPRF